MRILQERNRLRKFLSAVVIRAGDCHTRPPSTNCALAANALCYYDAHDLSFTSPKMFARLDGFVKRRLKI